MTHNRESHLVSSVRLLRTEKNYQQKRSSTENKERDVYERNWRSPHDVRRDESNILFLDLLLGKIAKFG